MSSAYYWCNSNCLWISAYLASSFFLCTSSSFRISSNFIACSSYTSLWSKASFCFYLNSKESRCLTNYLSLSSWFSLAFSTCFEILSTKFCSLKASSFTLSEIDWWRSWSKTKSVLDFSNLNLSITVLLAPSFKMNDLITLDLVVATGLWSENRFK